MSIWTTLPAHVMQRPMIPVISVGNLKGGVGKTSVVANLAIALTLAGLRVLAIDLDFQASLSVAMPPNIVPRYENADGGVHALVSESYDMFHNQEVTGVGVPPFGELRLVRTSLELADVEDMLFAAFVLEERKKDPRFALARKLFDPRLGRDFDIVIIDTPPRLTMASINAFCASTHVLIPTSLSSMSRSGAVTFVHYLKEFRNNLCPSLEVLGVLPTFTVHEQLDAAEQKVVQQLGSYLVGVDIWHDAIIPRRKGIENNEVLRDRALRAIFARLASKVVATLGLKPDGHPPDRYAHRSAHFDRSGLS